MQPAKYKSKISKMWRVSAAFNEFPQQMLKQQLPALKSRDPAFKVTPRKRDFSRANAAILWQNFLLFCWDVHIVIASGSILLHSCFDCLNTAIN